jgi:hypothetical protein
MWPTTHCHHPEKCFGIIYFTAYIVTWLHKRFGTRDDRLNPKTTFFLRTGKIYIEPWGTVQTFTRKTLGIKQITDKPLPRSSHNTDELRRSPQQWIEKAETNPRAKS